MSRNEWEKGSIKLSVQVFQEFRQELVKTYNEALQADFNTLTELSERLKAAGKGKRNFDYRAALQAELWSTRRRPGAWDDSYRIELKIASRGYLGNLFLNKEGKPIALKKKDFAGVTVGAKHCTFPPSSPVTVSEDGTLTLDPVKKTVEWSVSENNRACESARESFVGKFLFRYLRKVSWTRDTGGVIVGNDEYNEEAEEAGGAANYIKEAYGPRGAAEREFQLKSVMARLPRSRRR